MKQSVQGVPRLAQTIENAKGPFDQNWETYLAPEDIILLFERHNNPDNVDKYLFKMSISASGSSITMVELQPQVTGDLIFKNPFLSISYKVFPLVTTRFPFSAHV
jgi:hypothetical protein